MKNNLKTYIVLGATSLASLSTLSAQKNNNPNSGSSAFRGPEAFKKLFGNTDIEKFFNNTDVTNLTPAIKTNGNNKPVNKKKLPTKDELRLRFLRGIAVYRNVSSIMSAQTALTNKSKLKPVTKPTSLKNKPLSEIQKLNLEVKKEIDQLKSDVTLGNWKAVKAYLNTLPDETAKIAYSQITRSLCTTITVKPIKSLQLEGTKSHLQKPVMLVDDVISWIDLSKQAPSKFDLKLISKLITFQGELPQSFYDTLEKGTRYLGGKNTENRLRAAELLMNTNRPLAAKKFLISVEDASKNKNFKALDLVAEFHQIQLSKEPDGGHLQDGWKINRMILNLKDIPAEITENAMLRAFKLLPKLEDKTKGNAWFSSTLKAGKDKGTNLLAYVGNVASQSQGNRNENYRLNKMELQHATALALIGSSKDDLAQWKNIFILYAKNWLIEAQFTFKTDKSKSSDSYMNRDRYGNVYYGSRSYRYDDNRNSRNQNRPIQARDILSTGPSELWLSQLDELTKLECLKNYARLHLKLKNDTLAFNYIKAIDKINKNESQRFITELIGVWADNHDPNASSSRRHSWMYSYGYNNRAEAIPLTRSKQQRNLKELKELVSRLRDLGISPEHEVALAQAFIRCHSRAEIWRMDLFEEIFGESKTLSTKTINAVIGSMRRSLVSVWPKPKLQAKAKTNRTDKELEIEIINGYSAALSLTEKMIKMHPENWNLQLQQATLKFGQNEYLTITGKNSDTAKKKSSSLDLYALAAKKYQATLSSKRIILSPLVYENWFYAALGSADLATLNAKKTPALKEFAKIKASIKSLPPLLAQKQMDMFSNTFSTRISGVAPDLKFRYLKAGLDIVGDNKRASAARDLFTYYNDLVQELKVAVTIDGTDEVRHDEPFGIIVNLEHSKEIERESGGFSRYLQNQTSNNYYNYGRPSQDYLDKFSDNAMAALEEHFDVKSITFHDSKVKSYTSSKYGWRVTPYAYIVLQTKGEQVDRIPSFQIDFDFMDTSGHVTIPIASAELPIATNRSAKPRPLQDLKISQIFDDRKLKEEKILLLEVRADANGIIPPVKDLVDLDGLKGFEIEKIEEKDNFVSTLQSVAERSPAVSEKTSIIHLKPKGTNFPEKFTFPAALLDVQKKEGFVTRRYEDVDLVSVGQTIDIVQSKNISLQVWIILGTIVAFFIAAIIYFIRYSKNKQTLSTEVEAEFSIPNNLTPVNALHLLKLIKTNRESSGKLDDKQQLALSGDMEDITKNYFGKTDSKQSESSLMETIKKWI